MNSIRVCSLSPTVGTVAPFNHYRNSIHHYQKSKQCNDHCSRSPYDQQILLNSKHSSYSWNKSMELSIPINIAYIILHD